MESLVVVDGIAEITPTNITVFKTARSAWATTGSRRWSCSQKCHPGEGGRRWRVYDAVAERSLRYLPRPALDAAVAGAAKRPLGDSWAWARRGLSVDISPLVAVSLARWGHATRAAHLHNRGPSIYL
jgi:hypothetical protein